MNFKVWLLIAGLSFGIVPFVYNAEGSASLKTEVIEVQPKIDEEELHCLAQNIYHESRSDNLAGQYAVADVVLNRVHDDRWPSTICDVVREGPVSKWWMEKHGKAVPIKHRCQFSWYCDGMSDDTKNNDAWRKAQDIAYKILYQNEHRGLTEGATHYHAHYVSPNWKGVDLVGTIGLHKFYRAK